MVLAVPAAWMHYETLLFLPFAALLLHTRDREVGLARAAVLAISLTTTDVGTAGVSVFVIRSLRPESEATCSRT